VLDANVYNHKQFDVKTTAGMVILPLDGSCCKRYDGTKI
jgi:hypothetical protein